MADLLVATSNPHKLDEIRAVLAPLGVTVVGLDDSPRRGGTGVAPVGAPTLAGLPEPVEDAVTFAGNAAIKAHHYALHTGRVCLADDSGLEVDALDGAPGVRSARYAGAGATRAQRDAANNAKLLRELAGAPRDQRTARFVCCMCVAHPDGRSLATSRGEMAGVITGAPRGGHGFGYDPLLELADGRTGAELTPAEKNAKSHRGAAARAIAAEVARLLASS